MDYKPYLKPTFLQALTEGQWNLPKKFDIIKHQNPENIGSNAIRNI